MLEWFHKDHVTLKNQPFAITGINYITHYYCLYCILIKYYLKCIRCENNRFLLKTYKKLTNPKLDLKQPTIFWFIKVISIKFKSIKRFFLLSWPSQNSIKHNFCTTLEKLWIYGHRFEYVWNFLSVVYALYYTRISNAVTYRCVFGSDYKIFPGLRRYFLKILSWGEFSKLGKNCEEFIKHFTVYSLT